MGSRVFLQRWNAHQPGYCETVDQAAVGKETVSLAGWDTGFLRFLPRIYLYEELELPALADHLGGNGGCDFWSINGVDGIEEGNGIGRLVALERADQMQSKFGGQLAKSGPLLVGFLDPVLAEDALSGGNHRLDFLCSECLADDNQGN